MLNLRVQYTPMFNAKRAFILPAFFLLLTLLFLAAGSWDAYRAAQASQRGDHAEAVRLYLRASRFLFWRDDLREEAAYAALHEGNLPTAVYYLQRAQPAPRVTLALAYAYLQLGDSAAAQQTFEQGAQQFHAPQFYEGLASLHRAHQNWEQERLALQNQIALDVGNSQAHYRLGLLLTVLDSPSALTELQRAATLDPQFESAVRTLTAALSLSAAQPNSAAQMISVGRALGLVEEWALARRAFQSACELDPRNAEARAWLGEANQHNNLPALANLNRALELSRASPTVRALRGLYWERQGKPMQAIAEYLLAAEYDPRNPAWQASLADAYAQHGDLISARAAHERAIRLAPEEAEYWRRLALFCAEYGFELEETGLPAAQKAAGFAPKDAQVLDTLGYLYYLTRRYANAQLAFQQALEVNQNFHAARIHLALNDAAQGDLSSAYAALIYVRDADPQGQQGKLAQQLLDIYFP